MAYCTQNDIEKMIPAAELAELTAESGDSPDADMITEAIAKAAAEIDAYCGGRYVVPFTTVPDIIESLCVDMAIYHLYSRRDHVVEIRAKKYDDAIKFLKDVASGRATLGGAETAAPAASQDVAEISSAERVFNRSNLSGW